MNAQDITKHPTSNPVHALSANEWEELEVLYYILGTCLTLAENSILYSAMTAMFQ